MSFLIEQNDGSISLSVYIQPRASRNRIAGPHNSALKISITSPPADNRANQSLISFLAKLFGIPKSSIVIKSGLHSRSKQIILHGLSLNKARYLLDKELI